jgi:hypothetical protein
MPEKAVPGALLRPVEEEMGPGEVGVCRISPPSSLSLLL